MCSESVDRIDHVRAALPTKICMPLVQSRCGQQGVSGALHSKSAGAAVGLQGQCLLSRSRRETVYLAAPARLLFIQYPPHQACPPPPPPGSEPKGRGVPLSRTLFFLPETASLSAGNLGCKGLGRRRKKFPFRLRRTGAFCTTELKCNRNGTVKTVAQTTPTRLRSIVFSL